MINLLSQTGLFLIPDPDSGRGRRGHTHGGAHAARAARKVLLLYQLEADGADRQFVHAARKVLLLY